MTRLFGLLTRYAVSSGLTLVGKSSIIPPNIKIGRNCIIARDMRPSNFTTNDVPSGTAIGLVAGEEP